MRLNLFKILIIIVTILLSFNGMSQEKEKASFAKFTDKLQWGGNLGMSFGAYTYIQVAPVLFYSVTDDFIVGSGLDFTYYNDKSNPHFVNEGSIWSPRIFARYFIINDLFVHAEYQQYYYKDNYSLVPNDWVWSEPEYYAGGGYRQWMGQNSYMFIMLLFNLQSDEFNFGINPRLQMGFAAGF